MDDSSISYCISSSYQAIASADGGPTPLQSLSHPSLPLPLSPLSLSVLLLLLRGLMDMSRVVTQGVAWDQGVHGPIQPHVLHQCRGIVRLRAQSHVQVQRLPERCESEVEMLVCGVLPCRGGREAGCMCVGQRGGSQGVGDVVTTAADSGGKRGVAVTHISGVSCKIQMINSCTAQVFSCERSVHCQASQNYL